MTMPFNKHEETTRNLLPTPERPATTELCERWDQKELNRSDIAMLKNAAAQRWPVSVELRELAINVLKEALEKPGLSYRAKASIAKVVMAADKLNLEDETKLLPKKVELTGPDGRPLQLSNADAGPIDETERIAKAMAILDSARARANLKSDGTEVAPEVHSDHADGEAVSLPPPQ